MEASSYAYAGTPPASTMISTTPSPSSLDFLKYFREYNNKYIILKHYMYAGKLEKDRYKEELPPERIAFLVVCILIILGNTVVLIALWTKKKPIFYLLGNLTLSDLLAGVTYMANIFTSGHNTLKLTPLQWFFREGAVFITLTASVNSLLAIAIERHVTMVTMQPFNGINCRWIWALIAASWAVALFIGVLPILGWNCISNLDQCSTMLPLYAKSYILFCVSVFSAVLLAIVILYARVFRIVRINTQCQRLGLSGCIRKGLATKSQKNIALLKTVTIVLGVFIACWLPLFIFLLVDFFHTAQNCPLLQKADYFLLVAMINSLLNPIICTLTSKEIRTSIQECSFCKSEVASQNSEPEQMDMMKSET